MYKTYRFFGNLSVQNGNLCPDTTIEINYYKNGKKRIRVFDGACEKPIINIRTTDADETEFIKPYIESCARYSIVGTDIPYGEFEIKRNVKGEDKQMYALVYLYEGVDDNSPFAQTIAISDDKEKLKLELKRCVAEDTRYPDVDGDCNEDDEDGDEWDTDCNWIERQNYGGEDVHLQHRKRINLYAQYYIHSVDFL